MILHNIPILLIFYLSCCSPSVRAYESALDDIDTFTEQWMMFPNGKGILRNISLIPDIEEPTNYIDSTYGAVMFRLYTRQNADKFQTINTRNFRSTNFNPLLETRMIIHGWASSSDTLYNSQFTSSFLKKWNTNVILVDWGGLASQFYVLARRGLDAVAAEVASLVDTLAVEGGAPLARLHVIGHSMGAHVAGIAGKMVTSGKIGSIVGLDPAFPLFLFADSSKRLDKKDADYVEVIHTSILGIQEPIGHTNFYPNGGKRQPGCRIEMACSHMRVLSLYNESILSPDGFPSIRCSGYDDIKKGKCFNSGASLRMGETIPKAWTSGVYWLQTGSEPPFAII